MKYLLWFLLVFATCSSSATLSGEDVFQFGKNLLIRDFFDTVQTAINIRCTEAISHKNQRKVNIVDMNFILKLKDQNIVVPLKEPQLLLTTKGFNRNWPLVILITGWTSSTNDSSNQVLDKIYTAYRCRGEHNFVAIDTGPYIDTFYTWSALNTEEIGNVLSDALKELITVYPIEKIHLIGHSLGSHIAGATGRHLKEKTGRQLPKIISLDPANPCFNLPGDLTGLTRDDADFVMVIHSNPGGLGRREPIGHVDFFPGVDSMHPLPSGCFTVVCAHFRAPAYYAESVYRGNENNFPAVECTSLLALNTNFCTGKAYPMGYATPNTLRGTFFLKTNSFAPFGLNSSANFKPDCME